MINDCSFGSEDAILRTIIHGKNIVVRAGGIIWENYRLYLEQYEEIADELYRWKQDEELRPFIDREDMAAARISCF